MAVRGIEVASLTVSEKPLSPDVDEPLLHDEPVGHLVLQCALGTAPEVGSNQTSELQLLMKVTSRADCAETSERELASKTSDDSMMTINENDSTREINE